MNSRSPRTQTVILAEILVATSREPRGKSRGSLPLTEGGSWGGGAWEEDEYGGRGKPRRKIAFAWQPVTVDVGSSASGAEIGVGIGARPRRTAVGPSGCRPDRAVCSFKGLWSLWQVGDLIKFSRGKILSG